MLSSFWYCGIFFNIWERSFMLDWNRKNLNKIHYNITDMSYYEHPSCEYSQQHSHCQCTFSCSHKRSEEALSLSCNKGFWEWWVTLCRNTCYYYVTILLRNQSVTQFYVIFKNITVLSNYNYTVTSTYHKSSKLLHSLLCFDIININLKKGNVRLNYATKCVYFITAHKKGFNEYD